MEKINIRNMYIDLLNKIKGVEGVDQEYVDNLIEVVDQEITALDSDINAILSVIPEEASITNPLITANDIPAHVNSDWDATSGPAEILNKPTIPAAQVNSDWNASTGVAQILNKPSLATVATSGSYTDLSNKPTIPAAQVNSDWNASTGVAQILNKPTIVSPITISTSISSWSTNPDPSGYYTADIYWTGGINTTYKPIISIDKDLSGPTGIAQYNTIEYITFLNGSSVTSATAYSKTKPASTVTVYIDINGFA